ncbi:MAG: PorV/PorQ family protein, partial [Candidatus Marinimicrobia bacterium]|nr:PorV/PorQ family protein [Candidatus Neomarinimicrobiota bacterium]
ANFLKIGVGARATSMGDAFVALSDDITCLYWNPGGLGRLEKNSVIFQATDWILDSRLSFVGISYKLSSKGVFGLSMYSFSSGEIQETTLSYPDGTGNTFSTANSCFGLTYSRQITDRFSAGLSLKYVTEQLYLEKANTVAMDVGSLFVTNFLNNMRIGFSLSNLGGRMQLEGASLGIKYTPGIKTYPAQLSTEPWDIPLLFRFGLATDILNTNIIRMTVSTEVMDSRDFIHRISTGTELAFNETVFLRGGYKYNYDETKLTLGAGVKTSLVAGLEMSADYSYGDFGVFSKYQRFSVIIGF